MEHIGIISGQGRMQSVLSFGETELYDSLKEVELLEEFQIFRKEHV